MRPLPGVTFIAPLAYIGREGCKDVRCRRMLDTTTDPVTFGPCLGYHCSYCNEPCSSQGHGCPAAKAMIEAARKIHAEQSAGPVGGSRPNQETT